MVDHFCRSDLTAVVNEIKFFSHIVCIERVIIMPRYLRSVLADLKGIDDSGMSMANWLIGKYSLLEMFNLYPDRRPK